MSIKVRYFASFREKAKISEEKIQSFSGTGNELYDFLNEKYNFGLDKKIVRLSLNGSYKDLSTMINEGDEVVFIPPVAGG